MSENDLPARAHHPQVPLARRRLDELPAAFEVERVQVVRSIHLRHVEPELDDVRRGNVGKGWQ